MVPPKWNPTWEFKGWFAGSVSPPGPKPVPKVGGQIVIRHWEFSGGCAAPAIWGQYRHRKKGCEHDPAWVSRLNGSVEITG